jgi:tetratricopeptide (TPR) repeat protein
MISKYYSFVFFSGDSYLKLKARRIFKFYCFLSYLICYCTSVAQTSKTEIARALLNEEYSVSESKSLTFLKDHSDDLGILETLGDSYAYQEKWDMAIEVYTSLVDLEPQKANLHYKLGASLAMKASSISKLRAVWYVSDIKKALKRALALDPHHIEAHWAFVKFYLALPEVLGGGREKALWYASSLASISPVDGFLAKGYLYKYIDDPKAAELNYVKAVQMGGSLLCYKELSNFYLSIHKPEKAMVTLEKALEFHRDNQLHYQLGAISADHDVQAQKGIASLNSYIKNHNFNDELALEWAYLRLAQIYKNENNKSLALLYIGNALSKNPDFSLALEEKELILKL